MTIISSAFYAKYFSSETVKPTILKIKYTNAYDFFVKKPYKL